ncbi:MAG TPA: alpha-1,4-glucan--maltose-1-phosphate maltosyltransferase [Actinomycetota bacterium]|nr:alpha-1,4-glucan--maltose-1-phosphate maltosyltransferase [Actinomycetota bacterium]
MDCSLAIKRPAATISKDHVMPPKTAYTPIVIESIRPEVDCGRHRAKAIVGDRLAVSADIFRDGTAELRAVVRYRPAGTTRWAEASMMHVGNDRWEGELQPERLGRLQYAIQAWTDRFATWRRDLIKKVDAGQDVDLELQEGALLIERRIEAAAAKDRKRLTDAVAKLRAPGSKKGPADKPDRRIAAALDETLEDLMARNPDRTNAATSATLELTVDRQRARFGAWYEMFPRSTGPKGKHGTFKTAAKELGRIADMGFDIVYLPPIHPIGTAFRKGKNNILEAGPKDVGSPWAIGGPEGGHTAIHPDLGTIADFDAFVTAADEVGLEIALDFAIQCSPDHPWVKEHPDWFVQRPDGSIQYAENPPKKYQDIYPVDFDTQDREGLWQELKSVLEYWISHGVKVFRVDNPHTKAFPFWEWVIDELTTQHPDLIFLAEAFTRPKVMHKLAKLGFTQSYTYFTWRNTKYELTEYLTELTQTRSADYFRPNFFANTPDILHEYLQSGGPPAFKIRLVLAALLSPTYGIYSGYELFENTPVREGSEEYLDSEKYEIKHRHYSAAGNLTPYITRINDIRRKHSALSELTNLTFHTSDKDNIIVFSKSAPGTETILAVVSLNPFFWEEATVTLDLDALGVRTGEPFEVHDLITETRYVWNGPHNYVRLDPSEEPAHIFRITV